MRPISHHAGHRVRHLGVYAVESLPEDGSDQAGDAYELVRGLDAWPHLRSECRCGRVTLHSRISGRALGLLDAGTGVLTVAVAPDEIRTLLAQHPEVQVRTCGVGLDVRERSSHRVAEQLLHRLVRDELFAGQRLAASP